MTQTDLVPTGAASPDPPEYGRRGAALAVLGLEAALVVVAVLVGAWLNHRRIPIHADAAPLYASWLPHLGPGTPVALAVAVVLIGWGPAWAARLPWRLLLLGGYLVSVTWVLGLALVNGWSGGLATRLTPQAEYLHDIPKVTGIGAMLHGFTAHILDFQPGSWATHVAGHPPGAFLVFVVLDRVGLGGGAWAGMVCVLVGATAPVSVAVALRHLDSEATARSVLPFLLLFPGAVWVGTSADGIFTAVVAAGLALLAASSWWPALPGGVLLGFALYLSYGLALAGVLALVVVALRRARRIPAALAAAAGVAAVVVAFTAAGFWWFTGYRLVVRRYYQGWAADRPYGYWVWANLACLVLSAGFVAGPALYRAAAGPRGDSPLGSDDGRLLGTVAPRRAVALLPLAALLAIAAADVTGLSKAEVERIWLPYGIWLLVATACLPAAHRRWWLTAQALTALAVSHLLLIG